MSSPSSKWQELNDEESALMQKFFPGIKAGFVKVGERKWMIPRAYIEHAEALGNFEGRKDDTWVVTYPRSGTTLTQELVWIISNNFDFETAKKVSLSRRFPFFEYSIVAESKAPKSVEKEPDNASLQNREKQESIDYKAIAAQPSRRFVKTHLGLEMLPGVLKSGCKIVYVARNPKDVVVSRYHFAKTNEVTNYAGSFETYWDQFKNNMHMFDPYWAHVKDAWALRNQPNFLFIFYEELNKDLAKTIRRIGDFLEKPYTEEQVAMLVDHLSIDKCRTNPMINSYLNKPSQSAGPCLFIRKGVIGDWKGHFTPELAAEADEWIRQNLEGTDIVFPV